MKEHLELSQSNEEIIKISGINMKVISVSWSRQTILFCPWFPESNWFNDQIIRYISDTYKVSCVYPQYSGTRESDWDFLATNPAEDIKKVIQCIRTGKILDNKQSHITVIWSSFGWWIALSLSWDENIWKIIALSPLTNASGTVDRNGLHEYITNSRSKDYRLNQEGYSKLSAWTLFRVPDKYPEGKVSIWAVKWDEEIDFDRLSTESLKKNANLIEDIILPEWEKKHLSWSVINRSKEESKNQIFKSLETINERINFTELFTDAVFETKKEEDVFGILSHWSRIFNYGQPRDFDFILVLNKIQPNDLDTLNNIKNKFLEQWIDNLDITLIYKDKLDIWWFENFNLSTHWNYYSEIIANAKTLYWKNPFTVDSKKKIDKTDIIQWFRSEVWKYTDRLNREIISNNNPTYFKKYIERIVLSLAIAEWKITPYKSNYVTSKDTIKLLEKLWFDSWNIHEINSLLSKKYRDKEDWSNCMYLYNNLHLKSLELNKISITNKYLKWTFSKICNIRNNISVTCSKEIVTIDNPRIKIISCAWFEKWSWTELETDQKQINNDQLNKLSEINIILQQIQRYFRDNFWRELPVDLFFWDYWVNAKNKEELKKQFNINKETCNMIFWEKIDFSNLSGEFWEQNNNKQERYNIQDINELILSYWLSEDFTSWYLQSSQDRNPEIMNMIWLSISEHLNLIEKIISYWDNSILIYIGNSQKIRLMNELLKEKGNSNMIIWINT